MENLQKSTDDEWADAKIDTLSSERSKDRSSHKSATIDTRGYDSSEKHNSSDSEPVGHTNLDPEQNIGTSRPSLIHL